MGGLISTVFSDMYMCKIKNDVVTTLKHIFYKQYIDDKYAKIKRDEIGMLLML